MKSLHLLFIFALSIFSVAAETSIPTVPAQWKTNNAVIEDIQGVMRVRIPLNGKKFQGSFGRYIQGEKGEYLQISLGGIENAAAAPSCSNNSTQGGPIGPLFSGLNTFILPEHATGRSFYLSMNQSGLRNEKMGPWVDYRSISTTRIPFDAPVVTLGAGDTAKVGSELLVTLKSREKCSAAPKVRFFLAPKFIEYRFNKEKEITLRETAPNTWSATLNITGDAFAFDSAKEKKFTLIAETRINGNASYCRLPFPVEIKTANAIDTTLIDAATPQVRADRKLYQERTRGINLARGKILDFTPKPDYSLTTDDKDNRDLTDGKITSRSDDKVWFDRNAVGWYLTSGEKRIRLDLGKVEPVEKVVIRLLGGTVGNFKFPSQLELFVSKDGKTYHRAASMQKLMPCEADQADHKRYYYLEENAPAYDTRMYPFELSADADARFLLLEITGASDSIFSDELVCVKADRKSPRFNAPYQEPGTEIPMEGLIIRPRVRELAVMKNLPAPQTFLINDMRSAEEKKQPAVMVLELPEPLSLIGVTGVKTANNYTRYEFPLKGNKKQLSSPTLFVAVSGEVKAPAYIYGRSGKQDQFKTVLPVKVVVPPAVGTFKRLHVSLAWMGENAGRDWPQFHANWKKLGFNTVSNFPRYWITPAAVKTGREFTEAARKAGFKIVMNDSTFHEMVRGKKAGHEVYCQIPGRPNKMLCPSYRGEHYQKEMERLERCIREGRPDEVFYDIEIWHHAHQSAPQCTRCKPLLEKSGKSLDAYLFQRGAETMADAKKAIERGAKAAKIPTPRIGSYNRQALKPQYGIELWSSCYPASLDMAQPSLYVSGRAQDVHDNIRGNYKLLGNKKIIPWLTTGTYGEFDSRKVEQMVLEALLNGASGITYFQYNDFTDSPLDFHYHLKALAALQPCEDLVMDGKVTECSGKNQDLTCSMLVKGNEALLLVGNYRNAAPETVVRLPFPPKTIRDLRENKFVSGKQNFSFDVPKGDIRLFHIQGN